MLYLCKLINIFHHDHLEKSTVTSTPIDSVLPIIRPIVRPKEVSSIKQKRGQPAKANGISKHAKKSWTSGFLLRLWPRLNNRQKVPQLHDLLLCSLIFRFLPTFWFFFLEIDQEVFFINYLDLLVFPHQSLKGLEVFYWLIYRFSSTIPH